MVNEGYLNGETLWFALIAVLWIGYFFLEGFDFGGGVLLPFLGRDGVDRRLMVNAIEPVWDGNEVWLIVAGGATFAAFPELRERLDGWASVATGLAIVGLTATIVLNLYLRVMPSSLGATNDLTIWNASSTYYTLTVMTIVAAIFTPIVLGYQAWTYWMFRRRLSRPDVEAPT